MKTKKPRKVRRKHNKNLSETALGEFLEGLKCKSEWYGIKCVVIDKYYPSTKTCSNCGYVLEKIDTSVREWICPSCGAVHDRDANAAINIRNEALKN